jgi:membrane glycosyltransferase
MVVQIGIPARPDVDHNTQTRNAWVCDKCGFEEPLKSITAKSLLLYIAAVVVFWLIVNFSVLKQWKTPILVGLLAVVSVTVYLVASRADKT